MDMLERSPSELSLSQQCVLLGLCRSSLYYKAKEASEEDLALMGLIDRQYLKTPFYGYRRMTVWLKRQGYAVNEKRVRRLMRLMGLIAIYQGPRTSEKHPSHQIYPYLLRDLRIERPNQVWAVDITYIPMGRGFLYLVALMDWHSRYVLAYKLSNTLEADFCVDALEEALLLHGCPEIHNSDQGSQFTSKRYVDTLISKGIQVSMDGRGRFLDNIFVERLWRSFKYEEVYLKSYSSVAEARASIEAYFRFYNEERPHEALGYRTPKEVFEERHKPDGYVDMPAIPGLPTSPQAQQNSQILLFGNENGLL